MHEVVSQSSQQGSREHPVVSHQPLLDAVPTLPTTALGQRLGVDGVTVGHSVSDEGPAGCGGLFDDAGQFSPLPRERP